MFLSQHNFQDFWIPFSQQKYVQDDFVFLYDILPGRVEAASRVSGLCPGILRHPFGAPDEDQLDFYRGKELSGHQAGHADFSVRNSAKKLWVWGNLLESTMGIQNDALSACLFFPIAGERFNTEETALPTEGGLPDDPLGVCSLEC
jgi:hypothetical protein